jgi:DNA-binding response OmpR family regulator
VEKFRSVADMPPLESASPADVAARIRAVLRRAAALAGNDCPRGVQRFRTLEEAQAARDVALRKRALALSAASGNG